MELQHLQWFQLLVSVWKALLVQCLELLLPIYRFLFFSVQNQTSFLNSTLPLTLLNCKGWYLQKLGSQKILAESWNRESIFDSFWSLIFTFFESQNFLPRILELGVLTRISAYWRLSDFTIRHPYYNTISCIIFQFIFVQIFSSTCDQFHLLHIFEWLGVRGTQVTFSGEIFFPSKVPEFLHVLFN